jgi:hypothetical protein
MAELAPTLVAELDRLSPDVPVRPDWLDVRRRVRPKRRTHMLVAAAVVAAAVPALAFSAGLRTLLGLHPRPVVAKARLLVSAPIGNGYWVHFLEGPSNEHGWCTFTIVDHAPALDRREQVNGGGGCSAHGVGAGRWFATRARPLVVSIDYARGIPIYVTGVVARPLHVQRLALVWNGGSHNLVLRRWHFAGGTPALARGMRFEVVAYDSAGHVVAKKKLELK